MFLSIGLQIKVNFFLRIVDCYGYSSFDGDMAKQHTLTVACNVIEKAESLEARVIQEDRVHLTALPNKIGVSFSLVFKDNDSLSIFLKEFK